MKRMIAVLITAFVLASCATTPDDPNQKAKKGAAIGAVAGAAVGAIIGNQSDHRNRGAVIGAAVGAGVGAAIGHDMDKQQAELEQVEGVEVTRVAEDELNISVQNEVLFDTASSALRPDSRTTLDDLAAVFVKYPQTDILVEGHADSRGSEEYNQKLSEQRAASVKDYLMIKGVERYRITSVGYGEMRPRATNETPEGQQLNRRVEIQVKAKPQEG